jgi:hypothetical protein
MATIDGPTPGRGNANAKTKDDIENLLDEVERIK